MEKETEKKFDELITKNGLKISGMGILCENTKKMLSEIERIQKNVYFMEQRQTRMERQLEELKQKQN